mgnify:CR=1 FL=1
MTKCGKTGINIMKKYIYGFIISAFIGIVLGIITELALIYNINWLIKITQNEFFWVLIVILVSIFSKNYLSTEINSVTSLIFMVISYYIARLIKSGYTNIEGIYWYGIEAICVGLYVGTIVYLIKEKIINKKVNNYIAKYSFILMTIFLIIGIIVDIYCLFKNIYFMQPVYFVSILSVFGYMLGTISGIVKNKSKGQ